ncbi:shikimate kinase [Reichenbachiella sp. MALMAid0571]|uniref:shikimate kinase n=1 Tax=Reichenbachiella sp. MALMAid0571 TaxID=3143939 RepID=UPI0032DEE53B
MNLPKKIFLVGLPGSGKTTFGKMLSDKLKIPFIDLDSQIVENQQMSIPEIFKSKGEEEFRIIERNNLKLTIENNNQFLLATGGGAPCFFDNMATMISSGFVIFLNENIDEIVSRVLTEKNTRPLIEKTDNKSMSQNLKNLYEKRLPYYSQSHITLNPNEIKVGVALKKLNAYSMS